MILIKEYSIDHESDTGVVKRKLKKFCELTGIPSRKQTGLSTAVSELLRNVIQYAGHGKISFFINEDVPQSLVAIIEDEGPGIKNLEDILQGNYKSKTGLGLGLAGSQKLVDSFEISSSLEGTKVEVGTVLDNNISLSPELIVNWLNQLKESGSNYLDQIKESNRELSSAYAEIQKKQNELLEANEALEAKSEEIKAKNQELEDFTNLVAHDLKSPLNNITTILEFLDDSLKGTDNQKFSQMATAQAASMRKFIDQVLDFSKAGHREIDLVEVDLNLKLKELLSYLSFNKKVDFDIPDNLPSVTYSETELQIVLQNLLTNAVKYNDKETAKVEIRVDEDSEFFTVHIKDNGIGLSETDQQQLFRFGKILSEMALEQSSGVGLALIKRIIEKHGGSIWVKSKPNEGSCFSFTIPKNQAEN